MTGDELRRKLVDLIKDNTPKQVSICEIINVDESKLTCTVRELQTNAELYHVRLAPGKNEKQTVLIPTIGSIVLVGVISNDIRSRYVALVSEVDKIYLNGGENGGLVKIGNLETKLNGLVNSITAELTKIATGITGAGSTYTPGTISTFNKVDFENDKIVH